MALSLDDSVLLYSLQTLKDEDDRDSISSDNHEKSTNGSSVLESLEDFSSEATSIPKFIAVAQKLARRTIYITSIEWRSAPGKHMYHGYAVIHLASSPQSPPSAAIRIDRFGKLCRGFRERWWHLSPYWLAANNLRASTTVLAGPIGDEIVEPTKGNSIVKYEYWTHTLPSFKPVIGLKRSLENARNDACIVLNETIRPYVSNGLHLARPRPGRRWADARGLEFVHIDIANVLADAMDTGIIRCMMQTLCVWALPPLLVWSSTLRGVQVRQEYAKVVENYRAQLRHIVASFPDIDSEARSKLEVSWGVKELHKTSPLLIQLLDESLSKHAFISPHAPIATLTDIASRLDTLYPLLPESGTTRSICELHARTVLARLPDELWHGYATPVPPLPVSIPRATWRRAKDSPIFWVFFDIFIQWVVYLALIPVDGVSGIWVVLIPLVDLWMRLPWYLKERKFWQKLWKVYDGSAVQGDGEAWVRDTSHSALQGPKLFYGGRAAGILLETTEIGLESLRSD